MKVEIEALLEKYEAKHKVMGERSRDLTMHPEMRKMYAYQVDVIREVKEDLKTLLKQVA